MPTFEFSDCRYKNNAMCLAKKQVREKFPNLLENSAGWVRAVTNRYRRNV